MSRDAFESNKVKRRLKEDATQGLDSGDGHICQPNHEVLPSNIKNCLDNRHALCFLYSHGKDHSQWKLCAVTLSGVTEEFSSGCEDWDHRAACISAIETGAIIFVLINRARGSTMASLSREEELKEL